MDETKRARDIAPRSKSLELRQGRNHRHIVARPASHSVPAAGQMRRFTSVHQRFDSTTSRRVLNLNLLQHPLPRPISLSSLRPHSRVTRIPARGEQSRTILRAGR